jgi:hypothetical protein
MSLILASAARGHQRRWGICDEDNEEGHNRFGGRGLSILAAGLLFVLTGAIAPGPLAQTVHFSGAIQMLDSGFNAPFGVAADGSVNILATANGNFRNPVALAPVSQMEIPALGQSAFTFSLWKE